MTDRARADLRTAVDIARTYAPSWWTAEIDDALELLDSSEGRARRATTSEEAQS